MLLHIFITILSHITVSTLSHRSVLFRMTIDYPEDYELCQQFFAKHNINVSFAEILHYISSNPLAINLNNRFAKRAVL